MTAGQTPFDGAGEHGAGAPLEPHPGPDLELWTALLGKWMEFARASVAFPKDAEGDRMRSAVGPLIALHATICALGEIETLPKPKRALAVDVAGVQIGQQERILRGLWSGSGGDGQTREMPGGVRGGVLGGAPTGVRGGVPGGVLELITEARQAHRAAEALVAKE